MDKFTYNMFYEIEKPTVVLSSVYHKHYGVIENIDFDSFSCIFNMNSAQEISFDVYKFMDEHECSLWNKLISFKYVYIPEHNEYYKIDVTLDQDNKTVKHITGTSAGEYELSQRKIISLDVNTEGDLTYYEQKNPDTGEWEKIAEPTNTEPTRLYNPDNPLKSLLHRVLKDRAPDWHIGHVDSTVADKERVFSISNQTVYDVLTNTIATELDILFKFDTVDRYIHVYDLLNICEDCGERGDFTDVCPKCGGTNIQRGYGEDSHIFISANNYANKITVDGDEGSVKNCFRIMGGDDLMTATVKNCNPAGSEYVYQFSETDFDDMPTELVERLEDYADLYKVYEEGRHDDGTVTLPPSSNSTRVICGFKPNTVKVMYTRGGVLYVVEYKNGESLGEGGIIVLEDDGFTFRAAYTGVQFSYNADIRPYAEITEDYYNALTEYYYYKTSMMPRTDSNGIDIGHWQPRTSYNVGQTCYTITLPSYCYLECYQAGQTGREEFDCTNVIPSDGSADPVIIDEHDFDTTATIKWKVLRNIVSIPKAEQVLEDIKTFVNNPNTIVYFEGSFPAGITTTPQSFSSINKYVRDLIRTVVHPLFNVEILDNGNNTSRWDSTNNRLQFYIRVTNTTNPKDVASVEYNQSRLSIKCAIANSLKQHQQYMQDLVEKKLDRKDTSFSSIWKTEKRKNDNAELTNGAVNVTLDFVPEYVVAEFSTSEHAYTVIHTYDNEIVYYKDGKVTTENFGNIIVTTSPQGFRFTTSVANINSIHYTAVSDADFAEVIHQYSLDLLMGFLESYDACRDVLVSNKVTSEESYDFHGADLYHTMYEPYNHKVKLLDAEVAEREKKVKEYYNKKDQEDDGNGIPVGGNLPYDPSEPPGLIQQLEAEMQVVHDALNLDSFLKDPEAEDPDWMMNTLFNYIREGEYQNSNYISDGLSNNTLVQYGKELLEKGTKELKKATELQYTLSDELVNLLNTEEFAPFKEKFQLGDFIVCGIGDNKDNLDIDDHNYKLRLISLSYTYGSPESVSVTFANVTKIKNYFSDTQDILAQAKSMGTSYGAVTHQVEKNADTTATVKEWNEVGLNSALTRIMNNTREEVTYGNNGILVKEYDYTYDENKDNNTYTDKQLRITHNILAFTEDNWKTASLGLGENDYVYYDEQQVRKTKTGYGLIAKFVDAGYIHGSQFIAGDLFSDKTYNDNGVTKPVSHMNYNDGTFELAKGNLTFDGTNLELQGNMNIIGGDLTVRDTNSNIIFKADITHHSTQIGGWTVNTGKMFSGDNTTGIHLDSANKSIYAIANNLKTVITSGYTDYYYNNELMGTITSKGSTIIYDNVAIQKGFHIDGSGANYVGIIRPGNYVSMIFSNNLTIDGSNAPIKVFDDITFHRYVTAKNGIVVENGINMSGYTLNNLNYAIGSETVAKGIETNGIFQSQGLMVGNIGSQPMLGQIELLQNNTWESSVILRNDATNFYFLTRNGNTWSTLRPFRFNISSGDVVMGHNVSVGGTLTGGILRTLDTTVSDSGANCRFTTGGTTGIIRQASSSSKRYKHDIQSLTDEELNPHKLYDLEIKQYKFNNDYLSKDSFRYGKDVIGFIAEDVAEIYPIGADYNLDSNGNIESVEDWNFRYIVPGMLKLIQEQHEEIENLKQLIKGGES